MIREKSQNGKSAYETSKELGIPKNTAKKYMSQTKKEHGPKGYTRPSKLDPFKDAIKAIMEQGIFNYVVILERLRAMGYTGSITIIMHYVKPYHTDLQRMRLQWKDMKQSLGNRHRWTGVITYYTDDKVDVHKTPVFVLILGSSRRKYVEFTKRCDRYTLLRCMVNAF